MGEVVIDLNERRWASSDHHDQRLLTGSSISQDVYRQPASLHLRIARWLLGDPQPNHEAAELMALRAEELPTVVKFRK